MNPSCVSANSALFEVSEVLLEQEKQFANLAKALAHPARVRILKILFNLDEQGGCLNGDLVSQLGLAQSTVSEHLRILKQAEFIFATAIPPKMCYRINREKVRHFSALLSDIYE